MSHAGEVETVQDLQHLQDVDAPGGGGRRGDHLEPPERPADRFALQRPVAGEILERDQAAARAHLRDDALCHLTPVERVGPAPGDLFQGPGQVRLAPGLADGIGFAVGPEEQPQGFRVGAQALAAGADLEVQ